MVEGRDLAKTKAAERQQRIVTIRRRRRTQSLIMATGMLILLIAAVQLYRSGLFNVKKIDVAGSKIVSAVKVMEKCAVNENTNILTIDTGEIKQRIAKDPWIREVSVKRVLPQTLRVEIVERVPIALVAHGEKFFLIDEEFFVVAERESSESSDVPIITDLPIKKAKVGDRIFSKSLENAVNCLKSMEPSLRKTITLMSASSIDKLYLYNENNVEILYGEAKQARDKNKVLNTILKEQGKQVIFIDIRSYPQSDPVLRRMDLVP